MSNFSQWIKILSTIGKICVILLFICAFLMIGHVLIGKNFVLPQPLQNFLLVVAIVSFPLLLVVSILEFIIRSKSAKYEQK
ncbi:hypothetical protein MsAm2_14220 [Methanolapillus ohkumae]|uniref:Uncharacterized protein n=1 Tax=Methanolapillus ohkumae TaxID=3028298 RepID=A0AA96ZWD5_9EURY|nr:hypothetical protein MsAm2_14220 [Methanosarcinaceae archaeon Am2]